ncbi:MAG TPA: hypothetical protein VJ183_12470 [Chloroflexia bacterium]|nr:hypothetical protein [Chloroflexia bacterium]
MGYVIRCLPLLITLLATACGDPAGPGLSLVIVPEGESVRSAAGQSGITWLEPTGAGKSWQEDASGRYRVEEVMRGEAARLAAVDYPALSLADFITYTRALTVTWDDFTGQAIDVEAFGTGKNGERWTLYASQGPEIPQHPDRPLVHRWIRTYALYDMDSGKVTLLLATIRGEVYE